MAYKSKFLHFKTKASYNRERSKTSEGSEERKIFDAYISYIDEGPTICTWGKEYNCDINRKDVLDLIQNKQDLLIDSGLKTNIKTIHGQSILGPGNIDVVGPPGKDGTKITGVTATVDSGVGTPSVTVTTGGTEEARTYTFNFKNIKGEKGDAGSGGSGVGEKTPEGGEIFNDYRNNSAGQYAHAEGSGNDATGQYSHAEGETTTAEGMASHAEGQETIAVGRCSHAEGSITYAEGMYSHAEGNECVASGIAAHAEGSNTKAKGEASHASGVNTYTMNRGEFACGSFNYSKNGKTIYSVGIGVDTVDPAADPDRKNAIEADVDGNVYIYKVGNYDGRLGTSLQSYLSSEHTKLTGIDVDVEKLKSGDLYPQKFVLKPYYTGSSGSTLTGVMNIVRGSASSVSINTSGNTIGKTLYIKNISGHSVTVRTTDGSYFWAGSSSQSTYTLQNSWEGKFTFVEWNDGSTKRYWTIGIFN